MPAKSRTPIPSAYPTLALVTVAISTISLPALADDDTELADNRLDEITVTAVKRETNLMQTPLAITALSQDYLDREGVRYGARPGRHCSRTATRHRRRLRHGRDDPRRHLDRLHRSRRRRGRDSPRRLLLAAPAGHARADVRPRARRNPARAARHAVRHEFLGRHDQHHSGQARASSDSFAKVEAAFGNYDEREARGMFNLAVNDNFALRASLWSTCTTACCSRART